MSAILLLMAILASGQIETSEACKQKMDICCILDGSTNVCNGSDSCENWNITRQFCRDIANTLDIDANLLSWLNLFPLDQVALATFSNKTEKIWGLNKYTSKAPLLAAISGVPFKGGEYTDVASAAIISTDIFNKIPTNGDNAANKNVALLITNGVPSISEEVAKAASLAIQGDGVTMFVVCITPECPESWASAIASIPTKPDLRTYFLVPDYASLPGALEDVLGQICKYLENTPGAVPLPNVNITVKVG